METNRVCWRSPACYLMRRIDIIRSLMLGFLLFAAGCAHQPAKTGASLEGLSITGSQLVVAVAESRDTSLVKLYMFGRAAQGWRLYSGPKPGIIGRNGFARPGEKREGDGRVPSGLFSLDFAFGYAPAINSRMPYRQATDNDLWVDDVASPDYNTWVKRGNTNAASFEVMKLADNRYRHGLVIGYNRKPVMKGAGSAIFAHVWLEEGYTTSGCLALDETELIKILAWLDPEHSPQILMGTAQDLAAVPDLPRLPPDADSPGAVEGLIRARLAGADKRIVEYRAPDGFFGMAVAAPNDIADRIRHGVNRSDGLPAPITELSYLVITYRGCDGLPSVGELVVDKKLALPVVKAFAARYAAGVQTKNNEPLKIYLRQNSAGSPQGDLLTSIGWDGQACASR